MVMGTPEQPTAENRSGGTVLLDDACTVVAYTDRCPDLLGVAAEDAAVAAAVASTVTGIEDGRTTRTASGCAVTARRLSNGGWALELRPAAPSAPRADPEILAEILDSIDASLVVYDAEERYVFGNRRFHELYPNHPPEEELAGLKFEEMIRRTIAARIYVEQQAYQDPAGFTARRLAEFRAPNDRPSERRLPSGEWHLLRRMKTPSGMQVTLRVDISEQKRLQQELSETSERLRLVSEAKSAFLANMSHELRTPLNAIIGFADMMRQQVFGPLGAAPYVDYADDILRSGEHLLALINDLLDFSKVEAGALKLHPEPVDLRRFLSDELRMFGPEARRRALSVSWECPDDAPALKADPRALRQMLMNLVSNALKFTAAGTIRARVRVRDDRGIDIAVSDTGVGIPAEGLARIGEPFYQAHDPRRRATGGTGLGLALVRELMKLHDGGLSVESREGHGTTATLCFPPAASVSVRRPAPPAADGADASPQPARRHSRPGRP
ncbi:signal transduction histidine kinase [Constrictibacter sp. MBR-5]|jgi:signal transduction histidine kinase|uniref:sensor histidine kinase n=1 Tax=Constrictibacter sp. MBR-5 TaxID=3156467 RepID=UPI0033998631